MKTFLNPEFALEAQEDHLKLIEQSFSECINLRDYYHDEDFMITVKIELEKAERFYPNHPTTLKMRAEFDELKK